MKDLDLLKQLVEAFKHLKIVNNVVVNNTNNNINNNINNNGGQVINYNTNNSSSNSRGSKKLENLPSIVEAIWSDDSSMQLEASTQLRKLLAGEHSPSIKEVVQAGVVSRFVKFLSMDDLPQLQFEAAWTLTKIAGSYDNIKVVINNGAIPIFIKLLDSPNDDVRDQAVSALGEIANDRDGLNLVLGQGALPPLLAQLNEHATISLRKATNALATFCDVYDLDQIKPVLPTLGWLIQNANYEEVLENACVALKRLSECRGVNELVNAGICSWLLVILRHQSNSVLHYGLSIIENLLEGDRQQLQAVIDANIISHVARLLQHPDSEVHRAAIHAIKQATYVATRRQMKYLGKQGCIKPLCDLLVYNNGFYLILCLRAVRDILKAGEGGHVNPYVGMIDDADGTGKIENLQYYDNSDVSALARMIFRKYWLYNTNKNNSNYSTNNGGQAINYNTNNNSSSSRGSKKS